MSLRVLLIDDSAVMRKMVARSLRQSGLEVDSTAEAGNGAEGLAVLASNALDLVICDWNMPVMDGLQFVTRARETHTTPILMLTTEGGEERVAQALGAGADGYLTKPFTPEQLGLKVRLVLGI